MTLFSGTTARAADPPSAAETAFETGRRLAGAGDFAAALPQFEESERLEPALGTLLNLAACYEHTGRLASAWRSFTRGAEKARIDGQEERAKRASGLAQELQPRLSTISIIAPADAPTGEEVRIDGVLLDRQEWGTPRPMDGGSHRIEAKAPSRRDWSMDLRLASELEHASVALPPLELAPLVAAPPTVAVEPAGATPLTQAPLTPLAPEETRWTPLRIGGLAGAGVGIVGLGFSFAYGLDARNLWLKREGQCINNFCTESGYALSSQAADAATRATISGIIGGTALAAGILIYALAPDGKATLRVEAAPRAGGGELRLTGAL